MNFGLSAMLPLLAIAALIVWLHSTQPVRRIVPSLYIWLSLTDNGGVSKKRRRLPKPSALLFLQLAILTALVLALAQPFIGPRPAEHLVLVLDGSAQMGTRVEDKTAFDAARQALADTLRARNGAAPKRVSLILAGPSSQLIAARHDYEPDMAQALLADTRPGDGPADWSKVSELIAQTQIEGEASEILVFGPKLALALADMSAQLAAVEVPSLAPRLDVAIENSAENKWRVYGSVAGDAEITQARLEIGFTALGDIGKRPALAWGGGKLKLVDGKADIDETITIKDEGLVTVSVVAEDAASWAGSTNYRLNLVPQAKRVLYLADETSGDQPLIRALLAQENIEVFKASALPSDLREFALVVVDGVALEEAPEAHTIWIAGEAEKTERVHDADYWNQLHPLSRSGNWQVPNFGAVSTKVLPEKANVLVAGNGVALLAVDRRADHRDIYLQFDPRKVDWKGADLLPVLVSDIAHWLGVTGNERINCQVGLACALVLGSYEALIGEHGFSVENLPFTPAISGVFKSDTGALVAISPSADRFGEYVEEVGEVPSSPLALMSWLLGLALVLMSIEALMRWRKSGKRALTALVPMALLGAALVGVALPLPFAQSAAISILPNGAAIDVAQTSVVAGPTPRLYGAEASAGAASRITNIEPALSLGRALVPPYQQAQIDLMGPVRSAEETLWLPKDVFLNQVPGEFKPSNRPEFIALALPEHARPGDRLVVTALVQSPMELPVDIGFYASGTKLGVEAVQLQQGMNRIETELPPLKEGENLFTVSMASQAGRLGAMSAIAVAHPNRPVLVLAPEQERGEAFVALASAGEEHTNMVVLDPSKAPDYLRDWLGFDAVVLVNMPARAVTSREAGILETAVEEHGLGLIALGGNKAFGPGGYYATPFEKLSPLSARVPREAPEVTMVFVLDRSGSMNQAVGGGTRLELARQATAGAIELLNPASQVGVVVFDTEAHTILPLTSASDGETIRKALAQVDTGGGTSIAPGMEAGFALLANSQAQARHMIVMTDGLSLPGNFAELAAQMRDEGITVSAVAVGTEADARAVIEIATAGGGSVHASDDFAALPSILSQEAMLLSSPVREGAEQVRVRNMRSALMAGLEAMPPSISGLVLTSEKPEAVVSMTSTNAEGEEAPLMASWRYGNGSVLAFASDITGDWAGHWNSVEGLSGFWPHVLRQIRPVRPANGPWLSLTNEGDAIVVTLEALDDEAKPRFGLAPVAEVSLGNGQVMHLPMRETATGIYSAILRTDVTGRISAKVTIPAPKRLGAASKLAQEQTSQAQLFLNRPYWSEPLADRPPKFIGGADSARSGWGLRLVSGLTLPWAALALLAFLIALFFYMRPPRSTLRRATAAPSNQGLAS